MQIPAIVLAILFESSLVLVAMGLAWILGVYPLEDLFWDPTHLWIALGATLPLIVMFWGSLQSSNESLKTIREFLDTSVKPLFESANYFQLILLCLAAGLGEELLFRGVLQAAISEHLGPTMGLLLASLLFGMGHWVTRSYAVVASFIGLYFGWLYWATGNLFIPVLSHALYDFVAILIYLRQK